MSWELVSGEGICQILSGYSGHFELASGHSRSNIKVETAAKIELRHIEIRATTEVVSVALNVEPV